jgi:hypothetical protein
MGVAPLQHSRDPPQNHDQKITVSYLIATTYDNSASFARCRNATQVSDLRKIPALPNAII